MKLFLLALVLLVSPPAFASKIFSFSGYYNGSRVCPSAAAACTAAGQYLITWGANCTSRSGQTGCHSKASPTSCSDGTWYGPPATGAKTISCSDISTVQLTQNAQNCITGLTCVASCPGGTTLVGTAPLQYCAPTCTAPAVWDGWACTAPPCVAGTAFVGVGADTQPKCQDGCTYAISAPAVYGEVTAGVSGVHSRWVASGAQCSTADELVPADTSGCPNEVSPDMRAAICGVPSPCEAGEFLFSGECVADSAETGCVIVDGEQVCAEAEQNCVVINGKRVCAEVPEGPEDLETYKENGCVWSFAQAAWVCPTDTATKTTTGTTTTTTDPVTGEKTTTTTTTTRNSVTGGTTTTTTTVVVDADGNELSRDVVEQTTGTGGEGGTLLARDPEALGEKPDLDWLRTAQEVKDNLSAQWEAVPLVVAVSSLSDMQLTGVEGVCPEFCLPLWGETLCTTKHCEIWATVSFIISGVLLALYGMAAMRIVLSA